VARPRLDRPRFRLVLRGDRYYVRWWQDGAWKRVSAGTADRGEAGRFLAQFEAGFGAPVAPAQPTIGAILDGYLRDREPRVAAPETLRYACAALRRHLGNLEPAHLSKEAGRRYAERRRTEGYEVGPAGKRRRKPVSDGTIARELVTLRAALKWASRGAADERWITDVPYVEVPSASPPRQRWLTRPEAALLLAACQSEHVKVFVALALYTGARSGAILDLQWSQVDFEGQRIDLGSGTGNKSRAVVPIAAPLLSVLREARRAATCDYVVQHADAGVGSVKTGFAAACRRAKLQGVSPHILRHTAATWLAMAGRPMDEIARYLGNTAKMVEKVYAKFSPDYLREAADALAGPASAPQAYSVPLTPETPKQTSFRKRRK